MVLVLLLMKPPAALLHTHHDVKDNVQGAPQMIPAAGLNLDIKTLLGAVQHGAGGAVGGEEAAAQHTSAYTASEHEAFKSVSVLRHSGITQSALCAHVCVCRERNVRNEMGPVWTRQRGAEREIRRTKGGGGEVEGALDLCGPCGGIIER